MNMVFVRLGFLIMAGFLWLELDQELKDFKAKVEQEKISVRLINKNCYDQDFYVNNYSIASVLANSSTVFRVSPGIYNTKSCGKGVPSNCGATTSAAFVNNLTSYTITQHTSCKN